jgi:hypothetical protein
MTLDVLILSFTVWALALDLVATTCGLVPIDGRFSGPGIVQATSGVPNADTITLTLRGDAAAIDCAQVAVAKALAGGA